MTGRFPIENVTPSVAGGRSRARAVVGELVPVSAVSYRDGHAKLGCNVVWLGPDGTQQPFTRMKLGEPGLDEWHGTIRPDAVGLWTFTVEAWSDPYLTWYDAVTKKITAGQGVEDLHNELAEGAGLLAEATKLVPPHAQHAVEVAVDALRDDERPLFERVSPALDLAELLWEHPVRELVTSSAAHRIWVDRKRALFSAWYELFPRSEGAVVTVEGRPVVHGTFATAAARLPGVAEMGFDIVYLPPVHPIGRVNRKGRNNALVAAEGDVGSPWAIGAEEGGHDAIHPDLGTEADLRAFVRAAADNGLEVALDLALQCAPDHPWVREHPEWFTTRADGRIAYAENPPKNYQDIYPLNFDHDPRHPARDASARRAADVQDPGGTGQHAHPVLGHVRRLRAVRAPGPAGRRGVPGQREVPVAPAGLVRCAGGRPLAGALPGPAERDPAGQPGAALAA